MQVSTRFTLVSTLALILGGCARTSPDQAGSVPPTVDSTATPAPTSTANDPDVEPEIGDGVDTVGNSSRLPPTPASDGPAPGTGDTGNPGGRLRTDDTNVTGPNTAKTGAPPPR